MTETVTITRAELDELLAIRYALFGTPFEDPIVVWQEPESTEAGK